MKQILNRSILLVLVLLVSFLCGCERSTTTIQLGDITITDSLGNDVSFKEAPKRVVVLQASLAISYLLSGGNIIGISDEYDSYGLKENYGVSDDVQIIGSNKNPSVETIIALNPDLVIYSPDITGQLSAATTLKSAGFKTYASKIDSFSDYLFCLKQYTILNDNPDAYKKYGTDVEDKINTIISNVPKDKEVSALFMRAKSAGVTVFAQGHLVCDILNDLGIKNIAKTDNSLLNELSVEKILEDDPDYIFVVYMGQDHTEEIEKMLDEELFSQPSWSSLTAVKNKQYIVLPVDLFHFKPNEKWAEAYQYIFDIVYGK